MMSLEEIAEAVTPNLVLVPAGGTGRLGNPDPRYHEAAKQGSLRSICSSSEADMQAIPRGFARAKFEPCSHCQARTEGDR